jgi:hypothetical protein
MCHAANGRTLPTGKLNFHCKHCYCRTYVRKIPTILAGRLHLPRAMKGILVLSLAVAKFHPHYVTSGYIENC